MKQTAAYIVEMMRFVVFYLGVISYNGNTGFVISRVHRHCAGYKNTICYVGVVFAKKNFVPPGQYYVPSQTIKRLPPHGFVYPGSAIGFSISVIH